MSVTDDLSQRLVRMPLWIGVERQLDAVMEAADAALRQYL
jgi:dTDP-4-amino-4,6-dideoxygalactose transaminase